MKALLSTNAEWSNTGYAQQCKGIIKAIRQSGHGVAVQAWWGLEGGPVVVDGVQHFPRHLDGYGNDAAAYYCRKWHADLLITLIDLWVVAPQLGHLGSTKWVPLFPIDSDPIPPGIVERFAHAHRLLCYSQDAVRRIGEIDGGRYKDRLRYLPHGIDCSILRPATADEKKNLRRKFFPDWPDDAYVCMMVAANKGYPSRKSFPEVMEAFARFAGRHSEARLYLHSFKDRELSGPPLEPMAQYFGIGDKIRLANPTMMLAGDYTDEIMRDLYCAGDVLLAPSQGEGFGLPIVEAQSCFVEGTLVHTDNGYRPINTVKIGDKVLTASGNWQTVVNTLQRDYSGPMTRLRVGGDVTPITCTANHPWQRVGRDGYEWVSADALREGDRLVMPRGEPLETILPNISEFASVGRNQGEVSFANPKYKVLPSITMTTRLASWLGLYVAEGSAREGSRTGDITLALHTNETELQGEIIETANAVFGLTMRIQAIGNSARVEGHHAQLARLLNNLCGKRAENKRIPASLLHGPAEHLIWFIRGLWAGDGCFYVDRQRYTKASYTTVSQRLAYELRYALLRFGIVATTARGGSAEFPAYQVRVAGEQSCLLGELIGEDVFPGAGTVRDFASYVLPDKAIVRLRAVEQFEDSCKVYNLTVENEHTYVIQGYAVHNCGLPVISTEHSAMTENVGLGWRVKPLRIQPTLIQGGMAVVDVDGIEHAMEECYRRPKSPLWTAIAREFALQFDWSHVTEQYWAPFLAEMDGGRSALAMEIEELRRHDKEVAAAKA